MTDKFAIRVKKLLNLRDWSSQVMSTAGGNLHKKSIEWLNFSGSHTFIDRSKKSDRLLIVLAGYKSFLYPLTLTRIAKFVPPDIDVCILSSGLYSEELAEMSAVNGWSYLYTKTNKVSLVQNLAIAKHTQAKWIYKIDEDVFISENFFERILEGYLSVKKEGLYDPGFCAPLLNVNGYSYINFLKFIGAEDEYKAKFGELKHAAGGIKASDDGEAAKYLWKKSLPFDKVAHYIASQPFKYSPSPHRFSIGAILFEKEFWQEIGGFRTPLKQGGLGMDEAYLCKDCIQLSRAMIVIHNVFAGHFSFGPQTPAMKEYLPEIYSQLSLEPQLSFEPQLSLQGSVNHEI
ncbi:hypothetical protein [Brasilonema sennae]|uniref:hypothetical protein n=1 Tax=Brasilonema sennae TaxID=1397703 RepID=UPI001FE5BF9C|nr:hypothetical protein [Brasilonema sennae]